MISIFNFSVSCGVGTCSAFKLPGKVKSLLLRESDEYVFVSELVVTLPPESVLSSS
jgi:hypothetical protein